MNILVFVAKTTGLNCLEHILNRFPDDKYTIVVSEPDLSLISDWLLLRKIPYISLTEMEENNLSDCYDWLLNLWGGYVFKDNILKKANRSLNVHPSLLPLGKGRDPVVWAMKEGKPAGATLHEISSEVDGGDIFVQSEVPYAVGEKGNDVYDRVVKECVDLFSKSWSDIRSGKVKTFTQNKSSEPTRRRKDLLTDRLINVSSDSETARFIRTVLAHDYSPGYSAIIEMDGRKFEITLNLKPMTGEQNG
ncbi:MAG: formyltransferase family protein [Bdellovibrionota bacterium]